MSALEPAYIVCTSPPMGLQSPGTVPLQRRVKYTTATGQPWLRLHQPLVRPTLLQRRAAPGLEDPRLHVSPILVGVPGRCQPRPPGLQRPLWSTSPGEADATGGRSLREHGMPRPGLPPGSLARSAALRCEMCGAAGPPTREACQGVSFDRGHAAFARPVPCFAFPAGPLRRSRRRPASLPLPLPPPLAAVAR